MRRYILLALALLVASIATLGCIGGLSGGGIKDVAKIAPENINTLCFYNIQAIRDDKDLRSIYKILKERSRLSSKDVFDLDDINYMAMIDSVMVVGGSFNLDDVRDTMDDEGYDKDEYKGVEFWSKDYSAVAITGNTLILGTERAVKSCIEVMKGDRKSLYDENEDVRDIIDRLPTGIMMHVTIAPPQDIRTHPPWASP